MRRWTTLMVALVFVMAAGSSAYAQAPSGSTDKMGKDTMMDKEDDKMMGKGKMDKDKMMDKKDDKMMGKDKMGSDKMDKDKMMDKKQ